MAQPEVRVLNSEGLLCPPNCVEVPESQVSSREVDDVTREAMAAHSPDGRTPDAESRFRGRTVLWTLLLLGIPAVFVTVIYVGGFAALLMSLVYVAVLAGVSFPVWYSGMMRKREEDEAHEIVTHTLVENEQQGKVT